MKYRLAILLLTSVLVNSPMLCQTTLTNFEEAAERASEEGKRLMMVFSGSDWCKPCIQLRKEILESSEFRTFQKDHLVVLELDFPHRKKDALSKEQVAHNERMADKFNPKGLFPLVLLFDISQKSFQPISYKKAMSPNDFLDKIETVQMTASSH